MTDIRIRPMRKADLEPVLRLWSGLMMQGHASDGRYRPAADHVDRFRAHVRDTWLVEKPFVRTWVAETDAGLVGYVQGVASTLFDIFDDPPAARIGDLWVEPAHRRAGIGRRLVDQWLGAAKAAGIERFEVGTLALDDRAVAFWTSMGFGPWKVILMRA